MIPRIIHQTAKDHDISWEERRLVRRLQRQLPGWRYTLWTDRDNDALIGRTFPHHLARYQAIAAGVMKADIARMAWLYERGGFYLDTDYKLIQPISEKIRALSCVLPIERGRTHETAHGTRLSDDYRIGNAFVGARPGHPLIGGFIEDIFARTGSDRMSEIELMKISGPHGLTRYYREHQADHVDVWSAPQTLFMPDLTWGGLSFDRGPDTIGVHLCWGSWRTKHKVRNVKNRLRRIVTALV